jgi:excisionase family DNA binding protein
VIGRQVLTPAQAASLLGLSKSTVVLWCQRGVLPAVRVESRWYLKRAEMVRDGWLPPDGGPPDDEGARPGNGRATKGAR